MSVPEDILAIFDAYMADPDAPAGASSCGDKPGSSGPAASPCGDNAPEAGLTAPEAGLTAPEAAEGIQQCCGDKPAKGRAATFRPESASCACLVALFARLDKQIIVDRKRLREEEAAQDIATRRAEAAKRQRLEVAWEYWEAQAADVDGLQFGVFLAGFGDKPEVLERKVENEVDGGRIYVGATCDPIRRWQGGWVQRANGPPQMMRGHERTWNTMKVIAIEEGLASARLEARLIRFAKMRFGTACANGPADARGLSTSGNANFIYVCT
jgi:hypothetical protein